MKAIRFLAVAIGGATVGHGAYLIHPGFGFMLFGAALIYLGRD